MSDHRFHFHCEPIPQKMSLMGTVADRYDGSRREKPIVPDDRAKSVEVLDQTDRDHRILVVWYHCPERVAILKSEDNRYPLVLGEAEPTLSELSERSIWMLKTKF